MKKPMNGAESFDRLQAVMHYACEAAKDPSVLGRVKLNKVPWFADCISYMATGKTITGERYIKRQFGPVPAKFVPALAQLERDGKIQRGRADYFNLVKDEFVSLRRPDVSMFEPEEMNFIRLAFEHVCMKNTATSISEETHTAIWRLAEIGDEIPVATVFAAELDEITEADVAWANAKLAA